MNPGESTQHLPSAEITEAYLSDESFDVRDTKRMQISIDYGSSEAGSIASVRQKIRDLLHRQTYQIVVVALVLLDAAIVITTIMVDDSAGKDHKSHTVEILETVLHDASLVILSLFMIESINPVPSAALFSALFVAFLCNYTRIIVKLFALGLTFFKHKFEVFDAFVVIVSFTLDIVILQRNTNGALGGIEFIILLRLWRISRIVNGIIMSVKKKSKEAIEVLSVQNNTLQDQVSQLGLKATAQKKEIQHLREKLKSLGISPDDQPVI